MLEGGFMEEDLILMERLEARENKDILKVNSCVTLGVVFCATVGLNLVEAVNDFIANPPHASPKDVKEGCGYCSIQ
jgi:hypothetical protein